jgi:chromosome partitioning protein
MYAKEGHIVIDTGQRLEEADLREAVDSCDLLVIPATPSPLDTDGLMQTIEALTRIGASDRFRVLLTKTPPAPQRDAIVLRRLLEEAGVSIFKTDIPLFKAFAKAAGAGEIVSQTRDENAARAWSAYVAAGKEIL